MKQRILRLLFCLACLSAVPMSAQRHEIRDARIRSLQVIADGRWMELPVMMLNTGKISIDFDDLTHTYRRMAGTL